MDESKLRENDLVRFLLQKVRKKPGLYIQSKNVSNLSVFISGYLACLNLIAESDYQTDKFRNDPGFYSWFSEKYNIKSPTLMRPFIDEANGDLELAFELFFKYLEEYYNTL